MDETGTVVTQSMHPLASSTAPSPVAKMEELSDSSLPPHPPAPLQSPPPQATIAKPPLKDIPAYFPSPPPQTPIPSKNAAASSVKKELMTPEDSAVLLATLPENLQTIINFLSDLGEKCSSREEKAHQESTGNYDIDSSSPTTISSPSPPKQRSEGSFHLTATELSSLSIRVSSLSSSLLPDSFLSCHSESLISSSPHVISSHQLNPVISSLHALVREGSSVDIPNEALRFFGYASLQAAHDDPKFASNMSSFVANFTEFKELSSKMER